MSETALASGQAVRCAACGSDISSGVLSCPGCHRLVHADALKAHQQQAEDAERTGDAAAALAAWRAAADLLPSHSRQFAIVSGKIAALVEGGAATEAAPSTAMWKWLGGLGAAGLMLWKFKFLLVALATKGKFLLFGLTKASTAFSMLLSFGVYWTAWGMWFALGVVLSIYVHEMGHVAALRRFGIPATSPMFVPGLGAFVRLKGKHLTPYEDARIGLAGPLWGLGAAIVTLAGARLGGGPMWTAIAHVAAWVNLFNLLPVWHLDGNRGMTALSRTGRWCVVAAFVGGWLIAGDGLFVLLIAVAAWRSFSADGPEQTDRGALALFVFLIFALAVVYRSAS